jgi:hypothetical protein
MTSDDWHWFSIDQVSAREIKRAATYEELIG